MSFCESCQVPNRIEEAKEITENARKNGDLARNLVQGLELLYGALSEVLPCRNPEYSSTRNYCEAAVSDIYHTIGDVMVDLSEADTFSKPVAEAIELLAFREFKK